MPRLAGLALLAALSVAAPASGAVTTVDAGLPAGSQSSFSGPVLAAGRIFWGVRAPGGSVALRVGDTNGNRGELLKLPADGSTGGFVSVSASDTHVLVQREGHRCTSDILGACREATVITDEGWSGPIGGALSQLFTCTATGCGETVGMMSCPINVYGVGGHWATAGSPCTEQTRVLDLAAPAAAVRVNGVSGGAAGRFLVTVERSVPARAVVRDLVAGSEAYRVELPGDDRYGWGALVQSDGKIVVSGGSPARTFWASPADPSLHSVPTPVRPTGFADDRIFSLTQVTNAAGVSIERRLVATSLDGRTLLSERAGPGVGGVAWDATRIAWAVQPCQAVFIAVKPFGELAPDPFTDHSACPVPETSSKSPRLTSSGRAAVKIACPASATLGCRGGVAVALERPTRRSLGVAGLSLPAGESTTIPVALATPERAAVKRAGSARLALTFTVDPRATVPTATKARVRIAHVTLKPPR